MATTFFFTNQASDVSVTNGFDCYKLLLVRGSGVVTATNISAAGPISAGQVYPLIGATNPAWITNPLNGVTISSAWTPNYRGNESGTMANAGFGVSIVHRLDGSGNVVSLIGQGGGPSAEFGTAESVKNPTDSAPTSTTLSNGDRIRVQVSFDDASGVTMASGFTLNFFLNGTTSGASGDSFITFAETITEQSAVFVGAPEPTIQTQGAVTRSAYFMRAWSRKVGGSWNRRRSGLLVPVMA